MLPSETLAIAARLHVLLRRKTGRVTDTEWLAVNADYAAEIRSTSVARLRDLIAIVDAGVRPRVGAMEGSAPLVR